MNDLLIKMPLVFEPLRNNRWVMRFPSDLGISEWMLDSAARPNLEIGSIEIPFLNTSTYVAGRYKWNEISLTFRDPIAPSASQALMEWLRLIAESVTGRMGYAAGYKRDVELEMLDPNGVVVQKWIMKNAWIRVYNGGSLKYNDDQLATITTNLVMDYAILAY